MYVHVHNKSIFSFMESRLLPVDFAQVTGCPNAVVSGFPIRFYFTVTDWAVYIIMIINVFMNYFILRKKNGAHKVISWLMFLSIKALMLFLESAPTA